MAATLGKRARTPRGKHTSDQVPEGQREGGAGEHDLQPDQPVAAAVQLDVDVLLRVLDVLACSASGLGSCSWRQRITAEPLNWLVRHGNQQHFRPPEAIATVTVRLTVSQWSSEQGGRKRASLETGRGSCSCLSPLWGLSNSRCAPTASSLSNVLSICTKYDSSRFSTASSAAASASSLASIAAPPPSAGHEIHMASNISRRRLS